MIGFGDNLPRYTELAPGVRRIVAPNPSLMTGPGTNTYLFGTSAIAVLDPGPMISSHLEDIREKAAAPINWILVTHTHPDHSPGAAVLAEATGAELIGVPAPDAEHQDQTFRPDRPLVDGDVIEIGDFRLEALHTPGHASNHMCYRHEALNWLFTGDQIIDGSTVVINPPDGDMGDYLLSLERLRQLACDTIAPGHGDVIPNPNRVIDWTIRHRLEREAKVLAGVRENPGLSTLQLVPHVYDDVDPRLYGLAERSLLAHLIKLEADGGVSSGAGKWHP